MFLIPAGAVVVDPEKWRKLAACIREGLHESKLPITKAAQLWMDWDPAQLERGLSGECPLDARRLGMLDETFWPNFALSILERYGFPERVKTALKILPAVEALKKEA